MFRPGEQALALAADDGEVDLLVELVLRDQLLDDPHQVGMGPVGQPVQVDEVVFVSRGRARNDGVENDLFVQHTVDAFDEFRFDPLADVEMDIPADQQIVRVGIDVTEQDGPPLGQHDLLAFALTGGSDVGNGLGVDAALFAGAVAQRRDETAPGVVLLGADAR